MSTAFAESCAEREAAQEAFHSWVLGEITEREFDGSLYHGCHNLDYWRSLLRGEPDTDRTHDWVPWDWFCTTRDREVARMFGVVRTGDDRRSNKVRVLEGPWHDPRAAYLSDALLRMMQRTCSEDARWGGGVDLRFGVYVSNAEAQDIIEEVLSKYDTLVHEAGDKYRSYAGEHEVNLSLSALRRWLQGINCLWTEKFDMGLDVRRQNGKLKCLKNESTT